jgi:hypothetical protein
MNKFQKVAYQMAKDDSKKELYKSQNIQKRGRIAYSFWKSDRENWTFGKCLDFKNWSKTKSW